MGIRRLSSNPVLLHGLLRVLLTLFHWELEVADRQACPGAVDYRRRGQCLRRYLSSRTHRERDTDTHTHTYTLTHVIISSTRRRSHTQSHTYTHTHSHTHTNTHTHTHTLTHSH